MPILQVVLDVPLSKAFDYLSTDPVAIGSRVSVPLGRRAQVGIVVGIANESSVPLAQLRPILAHLEDSPPLPADWLRLTDFASRYYQRALGEVMLGVLPPRLKTGKPMRVRSSGPRTTVAAGASVATDAEGAHGAPVRSWQFVEHHPLTGEQAVAVEAVNGAIDGDPAAFLLQGITGSGKTEVYMQVAAHALRAGCQVLVLVPEIHLTPQLEQQFRQRFPGARIELMHSGRSGVARAQGWLSAQTGTAQIVLGTRLAVFTPFAHLGLIIIDEEHDPSFKQQDAVRYSARDLAVWRARDAGIPIVLGSATPSLESFANAKAGRYQRLTLQQRARPQAQLPQLQLINTDRDEVRDGLSKTLTEALGDTFKAGEQALLFLNRRGYAPVLACNACGWMPGCPRCSTHVAVHLGERRLRCHHCGFEAPIPARCPDCGNVDLQPFGRGTERLEETLGELFPQIRIARIDSDSMRLKGAWEQMHQRIHAGAIDLLVGTQMLAKGHDFPRLTLVAVVNADAALFAADYRAPERLFAQLQQVSGRAGRDALKGRVLIQTRYPDHPLYRSLLQGDYNRFAQAELAERARAGFPPSVAEAVLRAEGREMPYAIEFLANARAVALALREMDPEDISLYDPVPMSLARFNGWHRAHLLVQSPRRARLQQFLTAWRLAIQSLPARHGTRWHVDVDPIEF